MKNWLLVVTLTLCLSACSYGSRYYAENAYRHAKSLDSLQIPAELADSTEIIAQYEIPAGTIASGEEKAIDIRPPQIAELQAANNKS